MNHFATLAILLIFLGAWIVYAQDAHVVIAQLPNTSIPEVRNSMEHAIRSQGATQAYRLFQTTYQDTQIDLQHNAAHLFGEALFVMLGVDGLSVCDATFNYGCFHGFFQSAVGTGGLSIIQTLDEVCSESTTQASACQHGIGHGILEYLGHNHLDEALATCRDQTNQPDPLAGCTSGVFMEYNVPLSVTEDGLFTIQTRPLDVPDEPYHPCTEVEEEFRMSCYHELPQWWRQVYGADFALMGRFCAEAPAHASQACMAGLGNIVASAAVYEPHESARLCALMPSAQWEHACVVYSAWAFDESARADALTLCASLPEALRDRCVESL